MEILLKFGLVFLFAYFANASVIPPDLDPIVGIVGGRSIDIEQVPWQAHLKFVHEEVRFGSKYKVEGWCGGSIIHEKWILSAAHCTNNKDVSSMTVRVGTSYPDKGGKIHQVGRIINHSRYERTAINYDFSLLELTKAITFDNRTMKAISLPNAHYDHESAHEMCLVSGWGRDSMYGHPTFLQGVKVPLISNAECQKAYYRMKITEAMMCAGSINGHKGACKGDSGGPLVCRARDGAWKQFGVVSFGSAQCGLVESPGVYSRVQAVRLWIKKYTGV